MRKIDIEITVMEDGRVACLLVQGTGCEPRIVRAVSLDAHLGNQLGPVRLGLVDTAELGVPLTPEATATYEALAGLPGAQLKMLKQVEIESPNKTFFGEAIQGLREAKCAWRKDWEKRGMFVFYVLGEGPLVNGWASMPLGWIDLKTERSKDLSRLVETRGCTGCVVLHTEKGYFQPGWVPTHEDMFTGDWVISEKPPEGWLDVR